jgi:hypothetical protein
MVVPLGASGFLPSASWASPPQAAQTSATKTHRMQENLIIIGFDPLYAL